jgi:hypothetical protein
MAPRESEILEILQRLDERQDSLSHEKRESLVKLSVAIGVPTLTVLAAAAAFYFNSQADIRQLQRDVSDLKTSVANIATQDRERLRVEIEKQNHEIERLKSLNK